MHLVRGLLAAGELRDEDGRGQHVGPLHPLDQRGLVAAEQEPFSPLIIDVTRYVSVSNFTLVQFSDCNLLNFIL